MSHLRETNRFVSEERRTPEYERAVAMLRDLPEDDADRAYAEAICERRGMHIVRHGPGKITVKTYDLCINTLLGKACPNRRDPWGDGLSHLCMPPGADHSVMVRRDGKAVSWLSQPYQMSWDTLVELVEFCQANGLEADIDAWGSWHFPGRTLLVTMRKEEAHG